MKCKTLEVWTRSTELSVQLYKYFVDCKDYGFKDQITRSGLSVPSNIAEGIEKSSLKENLRFLEIARGSAAELITQIYIGMEIPYIHHEIGQRWIDETEEILKMIIGLQNSLRQNM